MSLESEEWLNTQTLIGFTDVRGHAWHYREAVQGDEPNHYPQAIPVEDVRRRLFNWQAVERPIYVGGEGEFPLVTAALDAERKAICRSDTGEVLGVFKEGYVPHQYDEWLVRNVERILSQQAQIGSAGLLRNGAQAWVSVEMPENVTTASGITHRPQLIAATSFDGSLATTYKASDTIVVCDNTLAAGLHGGSQKYRLKHTRYSTGKIAEAREALDLIFATGDAVSTEIERLLATDVSPNEWHEVLDIMVPLTDKRGIPLEGRSLTMATNKRDGLVEMYTHDDRVAPWRGTGWGVLSAYNTFQQHKGIVRGTSRVQRNMANALGNEIADNDAAVLQALDSVKAKTLVFAT